MLVGSAGFRVDAEDAIAVVVDDLGASLPARVDKLVHLITVSTSPVIPPKGRYIRERIIIKVKRRQMPISKLIDKNMHKPLPRRRLKLPPLDNLYAILLHKLATNPTILILTPSNSKTSPIRILPLQDRIDNVWARIVGEGLASWLCDPVEEGAEFVFDEVGYVLAVEADVVVQDLGYYDAEGAFVLEAAG